MSVQSRLEENASGDEDVIRMANENKSSERSKNAEAGTGKAETVAAREEGSGRFLGRPTVRASLRGLAAVSPILGAMLLFVAFVVAQVGIYGRPGAPDGGILAPGSPFTGALATLLSAAVVASVPVGAAILYGYMRLLRTGARGTLRGALGRGMLASGLALFTSLFFISILGLPPHIGGVFTGLLPPLALFAALLATIAPLPERSGKNKRSKKRSSGKSREGKNAATDGDRAAGDSRNNPEAASKPQYVRAALLGALPLALAALALLALDPGGYLSALAAAASWPATAASMAAAGSPLDRDLW